MNIEEKIDSYINEKRTGAKEVKSYKNNDGEKISVGDRVVERGSDNPAKVQKIYKGPRDEYEVIIKYLESKKEDQVAGEDLIRDD